MGIDHKAVKLAAELSVKNGFATTISKAYLEHCSTIFAQVIAYAEKREQVGELQNEIEQRDATIAALKQREHTWTQNHGECVMWRMAIQDHKDTIAAQSKRIDELMVDNEFLNKAVQIANNDSEYFRKKHDELMIEINIKDEEIKFTDETINAQSDLIEKLMIELNIARHRNIKNPVGML